MKEKYFDWLIKIKDMVKMKGIELQLEKIKSHSKDRWNDKADALAKEGTERGTSIGTPEYNQWIKCPLRWKHYRVELGTRAFLKKVFDAKNSARWHESKVVQDFEQEGSEEKYNWHLFWSTLKGFTGIRCTTLKKSKKLAFWYKVFFNELPVLEVLKKRRPDIYISSNCIACMKEVPETLEHLVECDAYSFLWHNIEVVATEAVWQKLSEETKKRLSLYDFRKILLPATGNEYNEMRIGYIKGLCTAKVSGALREYMATKKEWNNCFRSFVYIWFL